MVSMATRNAIDKKGARPTEWIVSQLLFILNYQFWYQMKAETNVFHPMTEMQII